MAHKRLSKLQKGILQILRYRSKLSSYEDIKSVDKNDPNGIKQLEADGYSFTNEYLAYETNTPSGKLRYSKKITTYQLRRSKLLFVLSGWQEYNACDAESDYAELQVGYWKQTPPGYNKKQVSLTRSLQTLSGNGLVDLLSRYEERVNVYSGQFAKKLGITARDHVKEKEANFAQWKETYEKERINNPKIGTFNQWFDSPYQPQILGMPYGELTTRRKIFKNNFENKVFRNTEWVRLTEKGIKQAEELPKC